MHMGKTCPYWAKLDFQTENLRLQLRTEILQIRFCDYVMIKFFVNHNFFLTFEV